MLYTKHFLLHVVNGPNLNMLGIREKGLYGNTTYESLVNTIKEHLYLQLQQIYKGKANLKIESEFEYELEKKPITQLGYINNTFSQLFDEEDFRKRRLKRDSQSIKVTYNQDYDQYELVFSLSFMQSNHEGYLIDYIQSTFLPRDFVCNVDKCKFDQFFITNPGGLSHTSVSLRDAFSAVKAKVYEVHISNIFAREYFRRNSLIEDIAVKSFVGQGIHGYLNALDLILESCK